MDDVDVLREAEINNFAIVYFQDEDLKKADHGKLNGYIDPAVDRFVVNLDEDQQEELKEYFLESESEDISDALEEFDGDYDEEELRLYRIKFLNDVSN